MLIPPRRLLFVAPLARLTQPRITKRVAHLGTLDLVFCSPLKQLAVPEYLTGSVFAITILVNLLACVLVVSTCCVGRQSGTAPIAVLLRFFLWHMSSRLFVLDYPAASSALGQRFVNSMEVTRISCVCHSWGHRLVAEISYVKWSA